MKYPEIDPVAFTIGPIFGFTRDVHWYGLMYLFTFLLCWVLCLHRTKQPWSPVKKEQVEDLIFYVAAGVIIGGRVGYSLFYGLDQWMQDPLWVLKIWTGGMSFHGGLIGVGVAVFLYARKIGQPFLKLVDWGIPMVPIGLLLGRLGNFIGQELWGRATDVPWAMVFPRDPQQLPRHPSQLYEAFLEGFVLFVFLYWFSRKPRATGMTTGLFLIGYAIFRASVEFVRQPDSHIMFDALGWVTRGQLLCVPMFLLGLFFVVRALKSQPAQNN